MGQVTTYSTAPDGSPLVLRAVLGPNVENAFPTRLTGTLKGPDGAPIPTELHVFVDEAGNVLPMARRSDMVTSSLRSHRMAQSTMAQAIPGEDGSLFYPTSPNTVSAKRVAADIIAVRTASSVGADFLIDETVLRDPLGFSGVNGGWQTWSQRAFLKNKTRNWLTGTLTPQGLPNADFALRIGDFANPYSATGDAPGDNYRYRGFGHGGMLNIPANNSITFAGDATNYQNVANWPVGTIKTATQLTITCPFTLLLPPAELVEAVSVTYSQSFGAFGYRRYLTFQRIAGNVGMNDSYSLLLPLNPFQVTHIKPQGAAAVRVLQDGVQKPTFPSPWNDPAATALVHQAYHEDDSSMVLRTTLDFGQPVRASDASIAAWGWNEFVHYYFTDFEDYAKFYVPFASSAEVVANRVAHLLTPGVTYECQMTTRTEYGAGGTAIL